MALGGTAVMMRHLAQLACDMTVSEDPLVHMRCEAECARSTEDDSARRVSSAILSNSW